MSKKTFASSNVSAIMQAVTELTNSTAYDSLVVLFCGYHKETTIDVISVPESDEGTIVLFSRVTKREVAKRLTKAPAEVAEELSTLVPASGAAFVYKAPIGNNRNYAFSVTIPVVPVSPAEVEVETLPAAAVEELAEQPADNTMAAITAATEAAVDSINKALDSSIVVIEQVARECAEENQMNAPVTQVSPVTQQALQQAVAAAQAAQPVAAPIHVQAPMDQATLEAALRSHDQLIAKQKVKPSWIECSTPVKIGLGVVAVAVVGAAGYYGYKHFFGDKAPGIIA